jgi:glycosyltransferase involved in cell wall biosynthesis
LKVLLVNYEYPPLGGGAANATLFMGKALAALGHEPTVLTSALAGLPQDSHCDGVHVHRIPAFRRAADRSNPWEMASFLASALWSAQRVARAAKTEAVITFFTIPCAPVGWLLNRRMGVPYIVSLRGGDVPGHVPGINAVHRLIAPLRRAVLRGACAVVANGPGLARLSERTDPVSVRVIPNGVDTTLFRPAEAGERKEVSEFRILFVGRLHEEKNVAIVLEAVAALHRGRSAIRVDLVGDGPQRRQLEALAASLGIADRVAFHGWQSKERVADFCRSASCLVNPSRYEGMPNTVLEAMASGLPVVASNVGGNNDLVVPGETGFLFDLPDVAALRRDLEALAGDPALGRSMGARGRDRAIAEHSWLGVAARYVELLPASGMPR